MQPIDITLKNASTIQLREATLNDAKELLVVAKIYYEESEFIPYDKGEFEYTINDYEKKIQESLNSLNNILIVATDNNKIIGAIDVEGSSNRVMQHTACISVLGMLEEWQGLGVGKALLTATINWAKLNSSLELIWLAVFASHKAGIALYEKMGFKICGRMENFFKKADNTYDDDLTMILKIE